MHTDNSKHTTSASHEGQTKHKVLMLNLTTHAVTCRFKKVSRCALTLDLGEEAFGMMLLVKYTTWLYELTSNA